MSLLLDLTGKLPGNLILNEGHSVTPETLAGRPYIFTNMGLFFKEDLVVSYISKNGKIEILDEGKDFLLYFKFDGIGPTDANQVYAGIKLVGNRYNGTIVMTYHSLGGNISLVYPAIVEVAESTTVNEETAFFAITPYDDDNLELEDTTQLSAYLQSGKTFYATIELREIPYSDRNVKSTGSSTSTTVVETSGNLPALVAKSTTSNAALQTLVANQGTPAQGVDTPPGAVGVLGWLSGIYKALTSTLNVSVANMSLPTGAAREDGNLAAIATKLSGTVKTSSDSLPLPTGAAQETGGNLEALVTAQGHDADGVATPIGGSGIRGWLSGIYGKLSGTLTVTFATLPAGSNTIGKVDAVQNGNWSVSALAQVTDTTPAYPEGVPQSLVMNTSGMLYVDASGAPLKVGESVLPTGAATEATLTSMTNSNSAMNSATGAVADAAYAGAGNGTLVSILKGVYAALLATINIRQLTSADIVTAIGDKLTTPGYKDTALVVANRPVKQFKTAFEKVIAAGVDPNYFTVIKNSGTNALAQTGSGAMTIVTSTGVSASTILRSTHSFKGNLSARLAMMMSTRIANQTTIVELVDVLGDNFAVQATGVVSTLKITVPDSMFNATDVGKTFWISILSGDFTLTDQLVTIASIVSTTSIQVTLSVNAASSTLGQVAVASIFGLNSHHVIFSGVTATTVSYGARRAGRQAADLAVTVNTSAAYNTRLLTHANGDFTLSDTASVSATANMFTPRSSQHRYAPDPDTVLYLQIRTLNGSTAPASAVTSSFYYVDLVESASQPVTLMNITPLPALSTLPVTVQNSYTVSVSNMSTLATFTPILSVAAGSTNRALNVALSGNVTNTDYSAQAWAAASGSGATIADATAGGAFNSFDINLTAWTAGASTGLCLVLQWSPDAGTTWYDIWHVEPMTAVGHAYIPPLFIPGRRRIRWVNLTGAATTATVTVTANNLSGSFPPVRQFFDVTAGVLSGTLNAATSAYDVAGCKVVNAFVTIGAATTGGTYQLQVSNNNGGTWVNVGAAVQAVASSTIVLTATNIISRLARVVCTVAAADQTGTRVDITACN